LEVKLFLLLLTESREGFGESNQPLARVWFGERGENIRELLSKTRIIIIAIFSPILVFLLLLLLLR
jgi:hypothetical protein